MNIDTLLISPEYIRKYSTVSDNMNDNNIVPCIIDAQLSGLQPIIGTALYDELCKQVTDDDLTEFNKLLLDNYIATYLLYQVIANMTVDNYQKQHNAGSVNYVDTNYQNIALSELKYMKQHWEDKASFYANRLDDFLHANSQNYPKFYEWKCGEMRHNDSSNVYHSGIGLGNIPTCYNNFIKRKYKKWYY